MLVKWLLKARLLILTIAIIMLSGCGGPYSVVNDGYGDMLYVPGGRFMMGDNFDEGNSDEIPVHEVYVDAFYIAKYKVTNADFRKFIEDGGYKNQTYWNHGGFGECGDFPDFWIDSGGNDDYPVIGVNWFEANAYCSWISEKTGFRYRLPTEAEWERAARGSDKRRYAWGNRIDGSYANYDYGQGRENMKLTPVGYYDGSERDGFVTNDAVSPYGAYDMIGLVNEWCSDWYKMDYYAESPGENPKGPESGISRVLRGGGYVDSAYYQRAAGRHKTGAHVKGYKTGFRLFRDVN